MLLKENSELDYGVEMIASSGWFKQFQNSYSLHNVKVSVKSVSAETKAARQYLKALDKLIVEGNYLLGKIFNMDKTAIFWK